MSPRLHKLPRAVADENRDYRAALAAAEHPGRKVSALLLEDNPFLYEFFKRQAVEELIARTCSPGPARATSRALSPKMLLPTGIRLRLATTARYFLNPNPSVTDTRLLIRMLALSIVFRRLQSAGHPETRCQKSLP
jgi:hypothetical protein